MLVLRAGDSQDACENFEFQKQSDLGLCCVHMPFSNAQHLVEYEKHLLFEVDKKSGNVIKQPMDSYAESILIRSYLLFAR